MSEKIFQNIPTQLAPCACCTPPELKSAAGLDRRSFLGWGAAGALAGGLSLAAPQASWAAGGHYESMLINCIDPRFTTLSWQYMVLVKLRCPKKRPNPNPMVKPWPCSVKP